MLFRIINDNYSIDPAVYEEEQGYEVIDHLVTVSGDYYVPPYIKIVREIAKDIVKGGGNHKETQN
ncbi:MAG: hypothetical protein IJP96_08385 [Synergistaceae bacterium]|nr:hypothetical protein [Synergistaceae bacterium]